MVLMWSRLWTKHKEARAVRKAVTVLAWMMPRGEPLGLNKVMAPVGRIRGLEASWPDSSSCVDLTICSAEERVMTVCGG